MCALIKTLYMGYGHPSYIGNHYNGYIKPYWWVYDHPLLWEDKPCLHHGTFGTSCSFPVYFTHPWDNVTWGSVTNLVENQQKKHVGFKGMSIIAEKASTNQHLSIDIPLTKPLHMMLKAQLKPVQGPGCLRQQPEAVQEDHGLRMEGL